MGLCITLQMQVPSIYMKQTLRCRILYYNNSHKIDNTANNTKNGGCKWMWMLVTVRCLTLRWLSELYYNRHHHHHHHQHCRATATANNNKSTTKNNNNSAKTINVRQSCFPSIRIAFFNEKNIFYENCAFELYIYFWCQHNFTVFVR